MLAVLAATVLTASACGSPDRTAPQAGNENAPGTTGSPSPTEPDRPELVNVTTRAPAGSKASDAGPAERLGQVPPSNHTSYTWDAEVQDHTVAASSTRWVRGTAALWTSIPGKESRVEAELVNETQDRSLLVHGHVVYELQGPSGTTEHSSELLDLALAPGEKVVVEFVFGLPSGDYEASSSFRPV
jgi:hypothetical protein